MALKGIRKHHIIVIGYNMRRPMAKPEGEKGAGDVAVMDVSFKPGQFNRYWRIN